MAADNSPNNHENSQPILPNVPTSTTTVVRSNSVGVILSSPRKSSSPSQSSSSSNVNLSSVESWTPQDVCEWITQISANLLSEEEAFESFSTNTTTTTTTATVIEQQQQQQQEAHGEKKSGTTTVQSLGSIENSDVQSPAATHSPDTDNDTKQHVSLQQTIGQIKDRVLQLQLTGQRLLQIKESRELEHIFQISNKQTLQMMTQGLQSLQHHHQEHQQLQQELQAQVQASIQKLSNQKLQELQQQQTPPPPQQPQQEDKQEKAQQEENTKKNQSRKSGSESDDDEFSNDHDILSSITPSTHHHDHSHHSHSFDDEEWLKTIHMSGSGVSSPDCLSPKHQQQHQQHQQHHHHAHRRSASSTLLPNTLSSSSSLGSGGGEDVHFHVGSLGSSGVSSSTAVPPPKKLKKKKSSLLSSKNSASNNNSNNNNSNNDISSPTSSTGGGNGGHGGNLDVERDEKQSLDVLRKLEEIPALRSITVSSLAEFSAMLTGWESLRRIASQLAVSEQLLQSFLSKDGKSTVELLDVLLEVYGGHDGTKKELMRAKAAANDAIRTYWKGFETYQSEVRIRLLVVEQSYQFDIESLCPIRYKIINTRPSEASKCSRPLRFITAVAVGPYYLEWNESGLIIPQKCCSKAIFYTEDLGKIVARKPIDLTLKQVAQFVATWNHSKQYCAHTCNSYHFVTELLSMLNVMKPIQGRLFEQFLMKVESEGSSEMCFTNAHKQFANLNMNSVKPTLSMDPTSPKPSDFSLLRTHRELDEFLWENLHYLESDDMMMFKCIDTAIHSKWNSYRYLDHRPNDCFFGDPERLTQSLKQLNILKM